MRSKSVHKANSMEKIVRVCQIARSKNVQVWRNGTKRIACVSVRMAYPESRRISKWVRTHVEACLKKNAFRRQINARVKDVGTPTTANVIRNAQQTEPRRSGKTTKRTVTGLRMTNMRERCVGHPNLEGNTRMDRSSQSPISTSSPVSVTARSQLQQPGATT